MGELQWSADRWRESTFPEFNYAASGYWKNWERNIGIPMREICYTNICMTAGVKNKPSNVQELWPLSIDKNIKQEIIKPTKEEIKIAREGAKTLLNGRK